nr:decarboxylase orsb [Quercus suber]
MKSEWADNWIIRLFIMDRERGIETSWAYIESRHGIHGLSFCIVTSHARRSWLAGTKISFDASSVCRLDEGRRGKRPRCSFIGAVHIMCPVSHPGFIAKSHTGSASSQDVTLVGPLSAWPPLALGSHMKELEASGLVSQEQLEMIAYKNAEKLLKIRVQQE